MKKHCLILLLVPVLITFSCKEKKTTVSEPLVLINSLSNDVKKDLTENILHWWTAKTVDSKNGGFYGRVNVNDSVFPDAEKGGILNARILWTYSSSYRILKDTAYRIMAKRSKDFILKYFIDPKFGGAFRSVKPDGAPYDTRKQVYTLSFFIYALSEYNRATGDDQALVAARDIYYCIEKYAADTLHGGYFELFSREWNRNRERLIGEPNDRVEKTMNTQLHLLESYTNLYRVWPDKHLRARLMKLVSIFEQNIIDNKTFHLIPFLTADWISLSDSHSYGHDIECSWLLCEAADVLGDKELKERIDRTSVKIATAAAEGLQNDGSMATEKNLATGIVTSERSWWEQSETIVGYLNAYELTRNARFLQNSMRCWKYVSEHFIDRKNGGWYSQVGADGKPGRNDKAGFWICPYHNGRMCLEVIERAEKECSFR